MKQQTQQANSARIPARFEAVLFDCDGVLVDSEPIANRVLAEHLTAVGLVLTPAEVEAQFVGLPLVQSISRIEGLLGHALPTSWYANYQRARDQALREELRPVAGIHSLLDGLMTQPYKLAVASGAEREKLNLNLQLTRLQSYFRDKTFSGSDVAHSKPAPDVYLLAAKQLGVNPARCVVIEDTVTGTLAGVAAGMTVWGYAARTSAEPLLAAGASQVFVHMDELAALLV